MLTPRHNSTFSSPQIDNLKETTRLEGETESSAISDHDRYVRQQSALASVRTVLEKGKSIIERAFNDLSNEVKQVTDGQPVFPDLPDLGMTFTSLADSIVPEVGFLSDCSARITAWFDQNLEQMAKAESEWATHQSKHETQYEEQKKSMAGKQSVLERIEQLAEQERATVKELESATAEESMLRDADEQLKALRKERSELEQMLSGIVANQIANIESDSSGLSRGALASDPNIAGGYRVN